MTLLTILIGLIAAIHVAAVAFFFYERRRLRIVRKKAEREARKQVALERARADYERSGGKRGLKMLEEIADAARRKRFAETGSTEGALVIGDC